MSLISLLLSLLLAMAAPAPDGNATQLIRQADASYAEKSFERAHQLYEAASKLELTADQRRWVELRLADTAWRSDSASPNPDPTRREAARAALEELIRKAGDDHDRIRAEAQEALGDLHWMHRHAQDQSRAQQHYQAALEWWAGSRDIALARRRYLDIVWRLARPPHWGEDTPRFVPRNVLLNALQIAETPQDRARARYLLAQQLLSDGRPASAERAFEHLEAIIREGKGTQWYGDALFAYASRLMNTGVVVVMDDGRTTTRPDFPKALELLRRLVSEFKPGESRFYDQAQSMIRSILEPSVSVAVGQTFLPDSGQEAALSWRNVKSVQLTIAAVDLTRDLAFGTEQWINSAPMTNRVRQWTIETADAGEHIPGNQLVRITPKLETGAYVIEAASGSNRSRQLLLVSDAHVLMHQTRDRIHVFVSHVVTGEPIAGARVAAWMSMQDRKFVRETGETNADGIAELTIPDNAGGTFWITAAKGARQAFHTVWGYGAGGMTAAQWRIYAFTDRPAYRPGETVQWKIIARTRLGDDWQTPSGTSIDYEVYSPRNEKVANGKATLNAFGSFWAELPLTPAMALGGYTIHFKNRDQHLGMAELFRLEEYKLPEFRVAVTTPEGKQYRAGESVEATIEATYYFGGPVSNATVEVVVREQPFYRHWYPWRSRYSWYFPPPPPSYGGNVVKQETLRTDANGRATIVIDTPRDRGDLVYAIEARVTDASRREVAGKGEVKVTQKRYSIMATPEHYLHRPNDKVAVDFKALDANDRPVQVSGTVTVVRRFWSAATPLPLSQRRPQPPPPFKEEPILTARLSTDKDGEARFIFTPDRDGYYVIKWASEDRRASDLVTAETAVWVTRTASTDIGYRGTDLELIIDKEAFRAGERAPVLIAAPSSGRWVVVTTSANDILETQVVRLDGTVKLIYIPLDQKHVPNFFLTASSVFDRTISTQTKSIVVPPVEHFIDVEVKSDREEYEPRQKGTVTITTRDTDGKPVAAEVALSVSDDSVTAIQEDLAGDPRKFFFGEQRHQTIQVHGSLHSQRYVRLVEDEGRLVDERYVEELRRDRQEREEALGGVVGGRMADMAAKQSMAMPVPPPPAAPPAPRAVAEAITVTAMANEAAANVAEIAVRSDFRSTAFWKPDILTNADGTATVTVDYPEALTTWRATARAATTGAQFGMGSSTARTNMPLIVRLQGPRFFVVGDRATLSAVINNNTDAPMRVAPSIEIEGLALPDPKAADVDVPAHGETRVDWTVVAERPGTAKIRVTGRGPARGDAMERTFRVWEHGIDKLIARSGRMRAEETIVKLELPAQRRATDLVVHLQPNLAVTMLDALPYLVEFPYGCTEQTMSRFLPAAVVAKALASFGDKVPVPKNLDAVTRASMARLYDFQHDDGAWGWWKEGSSDPFMTAYVIWGFAVARDAGLRVRTEAISRAVEWLDDELVKLGPHDKAWALHALAAWRRAAPSDDERKAFEETFAGRERLSAYSRALLALAAHDFGDAERAKVLVRNLEDGVRIDRTPDQSVLMRGGSSTAETMATAYWGSSQPYWWRWWEGPIETTAFALQAITRVDPSNKLVEPALNWLVKNRRGSRWSNTRDTAIAILALTERGLPVSREAVPYEILVNGKVVSKGTIDPLRSAKIPVDPELVRDANEITIRSRELLYFAAEARFVSLEEPVKAAGNEMFVRRDYYRLVARPTLLKGVEYDRVPLRDGESIASGERLEVAVTIETKNDYEYLIFEDLKPAGFEATELRSGEPLFATELRRTSVLRETPSGVQRAAEADRTGRTQWVYQELRDRNVALFVDELPQGTWEIRYTLRAEVPGSFHALPVVGHAFYVPDIRANSDEVRIRVE